MVTIIFTISIFMINSSGANQQAPFYPEHVRIGFSQSELSAADTIAIKYDRVVTTDWNYAELVFRTQTGLTELTYLGLEIEEEGLIVVRGYIIEQLEPLKYLLRPEESAVAETATLLTKFNSPQYNLVYDNGEVRAYRGNSAADIELQGEKSNAADE